MGFVTQKVSLFGLSCISVMKAGFEMAQQVYWGLHRHWHGVEVGHQCPSITLMRRAARLTVFYRWVIPLPPSANKQTHSLPRSPPGGLSQHTEWSITQWWIKRMSVQPSLIFSSPVLPAIHLRSLPLLDPPFLLYSPYHPSWVFLSRSKLQTGRGALDLIPHPALPAGTNRSLSAPGEEWACDTCSFFLLLIPVSCSLMYSPIQIHQAQLHFPYKCMLLCNIWTQSISHTQKVSTQTGNIILLRLLKLFKS